MLYSLLLCPRRLDLDLHEDPARRDPETAFLKLLWERGSVFEKETLAAMAAPCLDLSPWNGEEKERRTTAAMTAKTPLIYSGRIRGQGLLGEPDLLLRSGGGYAAGDIKSGTAARGEETGENGKLKTPYAVQLALYTDILEEMGAAAAEPPFVLDVRGRKVAYDLNLPRGRRRPRSFRADYLEALDRARAIIARPGATRPALGSVCKLCHWKSLCARQAEDLDDLTLIPELGRRLRDAIGPRYPTVAALAAADLNPTDGGIPGLGRRRLRKFQERARLLAQPDARPYLTAPLPPRRGDREIFFDIEVDPLRDVCYLHGFLERKEGGRTRFTPFLAPTPASGDEKRAFAGALDYLRRRESAVVYYYSKYERTWWRKLAERYPDVADREEIDAVFSFPGAVDLYFDVVKPYTEWPTRSYSIKDLASYLGFSWRDASPSGAASIEWYHRWMESGDSCIRDRILAYNEDDCRALAVLLDGISALKPGPGGEPFAGRETS